MYENGYRVAALPACVVLQVCAHPGNPLRLKPDANGNTVQDNGHVGVHLGDERKASWATEARILSRDETLA